MPLPRGIQGRRPEHDSLCRLPRPGLGCASQARLLVTPGSAGQILLCFPADSQCPWETPAEADTTVALHCSFQECFFHLPSALEHCAMGSSHCPCDGNVTHQHGNGTLGHPKFMGCSEYFARARKSSTEMLLEVPRAPNANTETVGVCGGTGQVQQMILGWSLLYPSLLKGTGKWD